MKPIDRRTFLKTVPAVAAVGSVRRQAPASAAPFGQGYSYLDSQTTGQWWVPARASGAPGVDAAGRPIKTGPPIIELNVPRDRVVAFALYTHESGVLKLTAQLYPLFADEPREARLEVQHDAGWKEVARAPVEYPGWSAHFRVDRWDGTKTARYRVRHGEKATFEGTIRRDPLDKEEIVVGNLSCNSSRTKGPRTEIVQRLLRQDPDLLFFSGDQTYHHTEHTAGWLEFGLQYRDVIKDRPTICIPDDHDVGHGNLWGEGGGHSTDSGGADGGYLFPAAYVNMVQRVQSWHLPDPVDPVPVKQEISVYFTRLRLGGIDFAILEDRKFKTGPLGAIPQMGPRPDHINDERYDPKSIDLPGLQLLGERQMKFLRDWTQDWTGAEIKCVLSQTAFCGAVHLHGKPDNRLLADLDCNGWPQHERDAVLREIRRARAVHLCGDQHLAVVVKHGIAEYRDGPYAFTSPALVNTVYARWWHPKDERAGANPMKDSPLPWTGDYRDGLGNRISMMAYANPEDLTDERKRGDGYGLVRFNKKTGDVTFECWPRFSEGEQFPGWPITVRNDENDGRRRVAWLPELVIEGTDSPVIQVVAEAGGEVLYTVRARGRRFQPHVYSEGSFTVKVGRNRPDGTSITGVRQQERRRHEDDQVVSADHGASHGPLRRSRRDRAAAERAALKSWSLALDGRDVRKDNTRPSYARRVPMRVSPKARVTLAALALASWTTAAHAQTGRITGTITDATRAVVPGATLTIVNANTNDTRVAVSNDGGQYNVPFLPSGRYTVSCELQGFQKTRREGIVLETDQELRVDFSLQPGAVSESVLVVGTPVLAADTSSVGQVVTGQTISDLPLNGRNFLQLARLATGVLESAAGDRASEGGAFVANGARSVLNSFMLDGVDNNARIVDQQNSSNVVSQPSVDALSEFSIQTNNFSAEHGQAAGAVINATIRSGTNTFRGLVFDFLRNDAFDARNPFAAPGEDKRLNRSQYGGTFGGPLWRDRAFFFASWETTDEERGVDYRNTVPTLAQRAGDFRGFVNNQGRPVIIYDPATTRPNPNGTGFVRDPFPNNQIPAGRINSIARQLLDLHPEPNLPDATGNYVVTRDAVRNRHQFDTRVDQSFSTNSKLYVRYSLTNRDDGIPGPYDAPLIGTTQFQQAIKDQMAHNLAIGQTQVLGGNRVNELRVGYNRIRDDLFPWVSDTTPAAFGFKGIPEMPGLTGLPRISIGGFSNIGEAAFLPNFKISEVVQAGNTFSFLHGRHALKVGANYRFIRSFFNISGQARGVYNFTGGFTQNPQARPNSGSGLADFLLGIPATSQLSRTLLGDIRYHYVAGYLQDDWRVSRNLTLNLGVRYELFTHPYERTGQQANLLLDQLKLIYVDNNVPPSIPDAFTTSIPEGVSPKTLMRLDTNNVAPRLGFAYKLRDTTVLRGGAGIFYGDHPTQGASGRLPANPPYQVNVSYATDSITPLVTLDSGFPADALEPVFSPFLTFNAWDPAAPQAQAYHWNTNLQHELPWVVVEIGYTGSRGTNLSVNWDPNAPLPGPGSVASRRPFRQFGNINGLKYDGTSDYHAGHVRVERRLENGFSMIGHYTYAKSIDLGGTNFISGDNVYRDSRDIRLDRGLSSFDVRHNLVLSYIWDVPVGSGRRYDLQNAWLNAIVGGWQFNGITTARSGTPFTPSLSFNPAQSGHARPDRIGDGNLPRGERSANRWFDPSAFAAPVPFNYGTAGRNILIGPGVFNTDFGLFKRFRLDAGGRSREIQIRLEAFNVFNQPHYAQPNATVDLLQAGRITGIVGTMREMQVGVKFLF